MIAYVIIPALLAAVGLAALAGLWWDERRAGGTRTFVRMRAYVNHCGGVV